MFPRDAYSRHVSNRKQLIGRWVLGWTLTASYDQHTACCVYNYVTVSFLISLSDPTDICMFNKQNYIKECLINVTKMSVVGLWISSAQGSCSKIRPFSRFYLTDVYYCLYCYVMTLYLKKKITAVKQQHFNQHIIRNLCVLFSIVYMM